MSEHRSIHEVPTDKDFYEFDWDAIHEPPLRETHIVPMSEHGALKKRGHKKSTEKKHEAPAKTKKAAKKDAEKPAEKETNDEENDYYYTHGRIHRDARRHSYESSDEDDYPVYPYEASIYYDARNGYDIYYDPLYESPYDTSRYEHAYHG